MHCLWITRQDPRPADSGELIYSGGLAAALAGTGVPITLVAHAAASSTGAVQRPTPDSLRVITTGPTPTRTVGDFLSRLPSDAARLRSPGLVSEFQKQLRTTQHDVVLIDHAALGWAADMALAASQRPKLVYISHNCEAVIRKQIASHCADGLLKRTLMQRDARKYAQLERRLCRQADLITAITPEDRGVYEHDHPAKPVIDLMPGYAGPLQPERCQPIDAATPRRVLMVGSFEWIAKRHNLEETLEVADPLFTSTGIEMQVVGKASADYAKEIERRYPCAQFCANVPDVEPYLAQARLGLIAETVGGGFKLKTLEYAFHHLPMAALAGALGGVQLESNVDAIVAPTLPALIASIVQRIDDFEFLNHAAKRTYSKFAAQFRWSDRGLALRHALESL